MCPCTTRLALRPAPCPRATPRPYAPRVRALGAHELDAIVPERTDAATCRSAGDFGPAVHGRGNFFAFGAEKGLY